jgi:hypothetical protein
LEDVLMIVAKKISINLLKLNSNSNPGEPSSLIAQDGTSSGERHEDAGGIYDANGGRCRSGLLYWRPCLPDLAVRVQQRPFPFQPTLPIVD